MHFIKGHKDKGEHKEDPAHKEKREEREKQENKKEESEKVRLGYWDIRGLAERVRQLLEYCKIPYVEQKYGGAEGADQWFKEDKPKLLEKNSCLTLPYLVDGEKIISES
jgi:hypothetical protein